MGRAGSFTRRPPRLVLIDEVGRLRTGALDAPRACRTFGLLIVWKNDRASRVPSGGGVAVSYLTSVLP